MLLSINKKNKQSLFQQIFDQITALIHNGTLKAGDRLPSTRELAKTIGVNRTTIIRVYQELWVKGYIESAPGSYTLVRHRQSISKMKINDESQKSFEQHFYKDHLNLQFEPLWHYLENGPSIEEGKINFLQLSPDTRLLDKKHIKACMRDALNESSINPFDFAPPRGFKPLRQEIAKQMKLHHIDAEDKNILITNGSLQSLQLIFQLFSKVGDYIVIEEPTHSIILHFIKIFRLKAIAVPMTPEGIDMNILSKILDEKPVRIIYTLPTYQNPTGISMPQQKREELIKICENKNCLIIEDSIEEEMVYSGNAYLPIKSIDKNGQVIYLGNFSKVMAPGLRIGWVIASPECIKKLTVLKSILEISSSTINQIFLHKFCISGAFDLHLRKTTRVFRKRMKVAVNSIKKYLPADKIEWSEPHGGYMIWLKLLTKKKENIEKHFVSYGVMVHNGKYFFLKEQPCNYIRICISQTNENEIQQGIMKIGEAITALY